MTPAFLARQKRLLLPNQYAREHENQWVDSQDSFVPANDIDACMTGKETFRGEPGQEYALACDIGLVSDPSVVGVGHRVGNLILIDRLVTLQGDRENPVLLSAVDSHDPPGLPGLPHHPGRIESWQGVASAQRLASQGFPVEVFAPTAKAHSEEWPLLAQALSNRTLVLPRHERLREELSGLVYEVTPTGVRVSDRGAVHQDHATVVRMIVAMLTAPRSPRSRAWSCTRVART